MGLSADQAARLQRCVAGGGVAVIPTDTVYGVCCDAVDRDAMARLRDLKARAADKPSAVMFSTLEELLGTLGEQLGSRTRAALPALLPGPLTLLLPNTRGLFPLAGGGELLGVRVFALGIDRPVLQSSANLSGAPDVRRVDQLPAAISAGADLLLDAGELPGVSSTVVDLGSFETHGVWRTVRRGAVPDDRLAAMLGCEPDSGG